MYSINHAVFTSVTSHCALFACVIHAHTNSRSREKKQHAHTNTHSRENKKITRKLNNTASSGRSGPSSASLCPGISQSGTPNTPRAAADE